MDAIKQTIEKVTGEGQEAKEQTAPGSFPKPDDYNIHSQRDEGKAIGIQANMANAPIDTKQEDHFGFSEYKAAGKLVGKKALVTGGDSGIGKAAAVMFAMEGADVAIVYLPEEQVDAEATEALITKYGRKALLIPADIRTEAACKGIIDTFVANFGSTLDILVNNASVMYDTKSITDITTEQFERTMFTNIFGTFHLTKYALKGEHIPRGGNIIITASQVAYAGPPSLLDYSMTKGAQVSMMRSLSNQLLPKGIRVNCVCPGPVWTPLQEAAMDAETLKGWHASPAPMGRIGQPSELGPAYVFLASSDGSFLTGQSIHVNGGAIVGS